MGDLETQPTTSNESENTLNPPGGTAKSSEKGVSAWLNKNMTSYIVERCADTILLVMNKIFIAPYDVTLELLDIVRNRKYSKYIVGFWSAIGITVLVLSIILFVLTDDFPLNAWSLGIVIASLTIILLGKHPVKINVTTDLTKEIEASIEALNNKPTVVNEEEEEEEEELIVDDDDEEELVIDDDDEELIIDEDDDDELVVDDSTLDDDLENFLDSLSNEENYSNVNPGDFFESVNFNNKDIL